MKTVSLFSLHTFSNPVKGWQIKVLPPKLLKICLKLLSPKLLQNILQEKVFQMNHHKEDNP